LVLAMMAEREALTAGRDTLQAQNERLAHLLLKLRRLQFGRKAERLPDEQLQLGLEDLEQAIAQEEAQAEKRDPALREARTAKRRARRGALPAHLPRVEVTLAPQDAACPCCRAAMTLIGEVRGTVAEGRVSPRSRAARRHPRPVPGDRDPPAEARLPGLPGHGVQTSAPARLIEGGLPTEALVAHVLVSRYADHLPLYRQAQIMARQGVALDRSTLAFWVGYAAAEVAPVVARLREILLASARLFADETVSRC